MKRASSLKLFALFCLLLQLACVAAAEDLKKIQPTGYVTDLAGAIAADTKTRLEALCTELQQKTGAQMAIVTVHSLEGQSVENYAVDLYKQLGVGSKQDNRGALLLVSPDERKYRIEVGYGLEPVINDARAGDAGRAMVPFFGRAITARPSKRRRGCWPSTLPTIVASRCPASRRRVLFAGRTAAPVDFLPGSSSFSFCSSGLSAGV